METGNYLPTTIWIAINLGEAEQSTKLEQLLKNFLLTHIVHGSNPEKSGS